MYTQISPQAQTAMIDRFGHDTLLAVATVDGSVPHVRTVNAYYEDGSFYIITYALSGKMQQIGRDPTVAVCGDWFTGHGTGEDLGWVGETANAELFAKLKIVFAAWIGNGHINESDPHTCILKIRMKDAVLWNNGERYELVF